MFTPQAVHVAVDESKPNLYKKETIKDLVKYVETQDPGTVHKLEIQVFPPSFAEITVDANRKLHTKMTTENRKIDSAIEVHHGVPCGKYAKQCANS